ncbi:hypothetical protein Glove_87g108 [Diversispora epigaea]|uniref:Uncharacterized protein n=1 Tax=Diversispora epigaea TaxID=1348612 RepID=A0A397JFW1_9GLOM|nr:hypothetical protein Glove_87g108 [Diversispora epigaea]
MEQLFEFRSKLSEEGDSGEQYNFGECYNYGIGTTKDKENQLKEEIKTDWNHRDFEMLGKKYNLGYCCQYGIGTIIYTN